MLGNYSIRELETLSSIKAHTIRIWEKRYKLLSPKRTDTNIRHYNDDDLRRLLNISTLLKYGWKISKVSKLTLKQVNEELIRHTDKDKLTEDYLRASFNRIMLSLLQYDEEGFNKAFYHATKRIGFETVITRLVYPVMDKIGFLWCTGDIMPAQEHFISNLVRAKVIYETETLTNSNSVSDTYLLFLPKEELHEIGLLMANYLIRNSGRKTIYLGQSVPFDNVLATAVKCRPDNLLFFVVTPQQANELNSYINKLDKKIKCKKIYVCGTPRLIDKIKLSNRVSPLKDIRELQEVLKNG